MALNGIEEEVILLKAVKEFIDSMVNFEMLQIYGSDPDSNILFNTSTHQKLFNVILLVPHGQEGVLHCLYDLLGSIWMGVSG